MTNLLNMITQLNCMTFSGLRFFLRNLTRIDEQTKPSGFRLGMAKRTVKSLSCWLIHLTNCSWLRQQSCSMVSGLTQTLKE